MRGGERTLSGSRASPRYQPLCPHGDAERNFSCWVGYPLLVNENVMNREGTYLFFLDFLLLVGRSPSLFTTCSSSLAAFFLPPFGPFFFVVIGFAGARAVFGPLLRVFHSWSLVGIVGSGAGCGGWGWMWMRVKVDGSGWKWMVAVVG